MVPFIKKNIIHITEPSNSLTMRKTVSSDAVKFIPIKEDPFSYSKFKVSDPSEKSPFDAFMIGMKGNVEEQNQVDKLSKEDRAFAEETRKNIPINWDLSKVFKDIWEEGVSSPPKEKGSVIEENASEVIDQSQIDCNKKFMAVVEKYGGGFSLDKIVSRIDARLPARIRLTMVGNPPCPFLYITLKTRRDLGYDPSEELKLQSKWSEDSMKNGGLDRASWIVWMLGVKPYAEIEYTYTTPSVEGEDYWDYL